MSLCSKFSITELPAISGSYVVERSQDDPNLASQINGTNDTFTIATTTGNSFVPDSLLVYTRGLVRTLDVDYEILNNQTIRIINALVIPQVGEELVLSYTVE